MYIVHSIDVALMWHILFVTQVNYKILYYALQEIHPSNEALITYLVNFLKIVLIH